ncbi:MAG: hypothetical protein WBC05_05720 [Sedimentisphaerales bacterium]
MKRRVGLWIDHRKAVIVSVSDEGGETKQIRSNLEKPVRPPGSARSKAGYQPEDHRDRQFVGHLNVYYDEVISCIRDAESILILGPGEAKGEIKKRIESKKLPGRIVGIETVDKMTDRQIAAKVRQYFLNLE